MTVWIVMDGDYTDDWVIGVYPTQGAAEAAHPGDWHRYGEPHVGYWADRGSSRYMDEHAVIHAQASAQADGAGV